MKKLFAATVALLLFGSAFFTGGFSLGRVKKGVTVNGIDVGGMRFSEAERRVREKIGSELPPFAVLTPAGKRAFPLSFTDNLNALLPRAERDGAYEAEISLQWVDAEEDLLSLCGEFAEEAEDARLFFSSAGFRYEEEREGKYCESEKLLNDVWSALKEGKTEATLSVRTYSPAVTEEILHSRTRVLSRFSTAYDGSKRARSHNIALSASKISGTTVEAGEEFSFNKIVGKRTRENGFEEAPVISGGKFVQGVGGGVCQTSSTLMNAALLAGLNITESHPHSIAVHYVPLSLDAMVSETSDFRFVNPYPFPVYLQLCAGDGRLTVTVYGKPDGRTYRTESVLLARLPIPSSQTTLNPSFGQDSLNLPDKDCGDLSFEKVTPILSFHQSPLTPFCDKDTLSLILDEGTPFPSPAQTTLTRFCDKDTLSSVLVEGTPFPSRAQTTLTPIDDKDEEEDDQSLSSDRFYLLTESRLLTYENGTLLSRTLIRRDTYSPSSL